MSDENVLVPPIWVKEIELYSIRGGLLCRAFEPTSSKRRQFTQTQTVIPYSLRRALMKEYHDSPLAGHLAFLRTYLRIQDKFYWPEMRNEINMYCKDCETCARQRRISTKTFLNPIEITHAPFEVLGLDFLGPIRPHSLQGNNFVLVITDYFTKWVEVVALPNQTALATSKALMERVILYHGPPKKIITDRGTNFTSKLFNHICQALKTKHTTTTAYHPQSKGLTERFNKTVVEMIRKYISDGFENWEEVLGVVASAYGNSVHSSTLETPYFLNYGRDPSMVVDKLLIPDSTLVTPRDYKSQIMQRLSEGFVLAQRNLVDARNRQKIQYDKKAKDSLYEVGDKVLLDIRIVIPGTSKKVNPLYQGPCRVLKVNSNGTVEIRSYDGGRVQLTHVNRLKLLSESMIWSDEECVEFNDLRKDKPLEILASEPNLPLEGESCSREPDQPLESLPPQLAKAPRKGKRKLPLVPSVITRPTVERRTGLRPWSTLRRTVRFEDQ